MMNIVWSARANKEWKAVALYIHREFGKKAAVLAVLANRIHTK